MGQVNFQAKTTGNYYEVEKALYGAIDRHLPEGSFSYQYKPKPKALNMAMFFGRGGDVFMSHGVADKNYLYRRKPEGGFMINDYAALFVPGPWLKDKLLRTPGVTLRPEQIVTVGWPRLDTLLEKQKSQAKTKGEKLKVLWAPTHDARRHGSDNISTSSYPDFMPFTERLAEKVDLSIGLHPRNRTDKQPTGITMLEADVVISDFGTMVYEAWALGKPVIFPYWIVGKGVQKFRPKSAEAHIFKKRLGYHPDSFEEMLEILEQPLTVGPDVTAFMEQYLPRETWGRSGALCAAELTRLADTLDTLRTRPAAMPGPVRAAAKPAEKPAAKPKPQKGKGGKAPRKAKAKVAAPPPPPPKPPSLTARLAGVFDQFRKK